MTYKIIEITRQAMVLKIQLEYYILIVLLKIFWCHEVFYLKNVAVSSGCRQIDNVF